MQENKPKNQIPGYVSKELEPVIGPKTPEDQSQRIKELKKEISEWDKKAEEIVLQIQAEYKIIENEEFTEEEREIAESLLASLIKSFDDTVERVKTMRLELNRLF